MMLSSWLSQSTEEMKIGTENKDAVQKALSQHAFVVKLFDCGLFESQSDPSKVNSAVVKDQKKLEDEEDMPSEQKEKLKVMQRSKEMLTVAKAKKI
jgi:Arc/MetJ-type ribon-helix-helix transcriptional regulator